MLRTILIILLVTVNLHCKDKKKGKNVSKVYTSKVENQNLSLDQIGFNFNAEKDKKNKGYIKITAVLYNRNTDTVYFLSRTDHGKQYLLQYDTSRFEYFPEAIFHVSNPIIEKIPPSGQVYFDALFKQKTNDNKIQLGFDFCRVDKGFDIRLNKVVEFEKRRRKTILTTDEKIIQ